MGAFFFTDHMADSCCNPFDLPSHNWSSRRKNLRPVLEWMCNKADISMGSKICDFCRKTLAKQPDLDDHSATCHVALPDDQYLDGCEAVASVNRCLLEIGQTPIAVNAAPKRLEHKMSVLTEAVKELVLDLPEKTSGKADDSEMILQLKEKFRVTTKRSEQVQILTVLPKSWTKKRIQAEFGVSDYMARKSKQLVREKGILSTPDPKPGPCLPTNTVQLVTDFFQMKLAE